MQKNFNNQKTLLNDHDIDSIINIVGYRCRIKTIQRLRSILTYHPSSVGSFGILDRLTKEESGEWSYCAGQDYTSEIKTVRECILGRI